MTDMTPADRRELRSIVRQRFKVLRAEVARREKEMVAEIEHDLATRYQQQDAAAERAAAEVEEARVEFMRKVRDIGQRLKDEHPELSIQHGIHGALMTGDENRAQIRRAALTAVPARVADAQLDLERQEARLLEELAVGSLSGDAAREFLAGIPTVGALVPLARLEELVEGPKQ